MATRPRIVSIEGNIGAGKSTLVQTLKEKYTDCKDILFLQEPVDVWSQIQQDGKNMIELFYQDQRKYSFAFQILAYTTRLQTIQQAVKEAEENGVRVIVMERSLEADRNIFAKMLYDQGVMEPCMYQIYEKMSDDGLRQYMADGILWINTPPEVCQTRILGRGRPGEEDIGLDYLAQCDCYHREWLGGDTGYVFLVDENVDWNKLDMYLYGDTKIMP